MTNNKASWPVQAIVDELMKECASKGPLYVPPPCSNYPIDEPPAVVKEKRINLGTLHVAKVNPNDNRIQARPDLQEELKLVRQRAARTQHPTLTEHMVSGYGGFVPKNQFKLGKTYQETCVKSIAELEAESGGKSYDRCKPNGKAADKASDKFCAGLKSVSEPDAENGGNSNDCKTLDRAPTKTSDNMTRYGAQEYHRTQEQNATDYMSPYKMANRDPEKYYKAGYAGFVPRTQNKIGTNVEVTHLALNEFTDAQKQLNSPTNRKNSNIC